MNSLGVNPFKVPGIILDSQVILDLFLEHYKYTSVVTFVIALRRLRELIKNQTLNS